MFKKKKYLLIFMILLVGGIVLLSQNTFQKKIKTPFQYSLKKSDAVFKNTNRITVQKDSIVSKHFSYHIKYQNFAKKSLTQNVYLPSVSISLHIKDKAPLVLNENDLNRLTEINHSHLILKHINFDETLYFTQNEIQFKIDFLDSRTHEFQKYHLILHKSHSIKMEYQYTYNQT